jgi:hypothetical protein
MQDTNKPILRSHGMKLTNLFGAIIDRPGKRRKVRANAPLFDITTYSEEADRDLKFNLVYRSGALIFVTTRQ